MAQAWAITDSNGVVVNQVYSDGDPFTSGAATKGPGQSAVKVDRFGDMGREKLIAGKWQMDMTLLKPKLLDQIDDRRETEQMKYLTTGGAKKMVYTQKAAERKDYRALGSAAIALLNLTAQRTRFPAAFAEVDMTGDTLAVVMARFETGENNSNAKVYKLEAIAQKAKLAVKAATTEAAAIAAANPNWTV